MCRSFCSSNTAGDFDTRSSENAWISSSVVKNSVLLGAPAEQREVVAHGLGQVAALAQLLHGGGAVALESFLPSGPCSSGTCA